MPTETNVLIYYLGVDLGGSKTLALVASAAGEPQGQATLPTPADQGPDAVVAVMAEAARQAMEEAGVTAAGLRGAGIAAAGAIDAARGLVVHAPQFPGWADVPLVGLFRASTGLPAVIGNDANLAALSEQRFGAGKGIPNLLYVTVSTGIGGGIVIGNHLYTGAQGYAGEVGHITVDAHGPYGRSKTRGAVESLASGTALGRIATERIDAGERSGIRRGPGGITAQDVFAAYREGDAVAASVVAEGIHSLGLGLTSMVNVLDPGMIVIGGGLSNEWDAYIAPAVEIMREQAFAGMGKDIPVVPPKLGTETGALGAVALAADTY
jgi:glucokinase